MTVSYKKDEGILKFIAFNCPKIHEKLRGKITRGAVLHTEITRALGKPDCNVTEIELTAWEDELTKKAAPVAKKHSKQSHTANSQQSRTANSKQLELDLA